MCRLVYFDGVVAQIQQYLRTADDPYLRSQWQKAKEDLVAEFRIVKEISSTKCTSRHVTLRSTLSLSLSPPHS